MGEGDSKWHKVQLNGLTLKKASVSSLVKTEKTFSYISQRSKPTVSKHLKKVKQ